MNNLGTHEKIVPEQVRGWGAMALDYIVSPFIASLWGQYSDPMIVTMSNQGNIRISDGCIYA